MTPKELENRLVQFTIDIIKLTEGIKPTIAGKKLSNHIVRSGTSPALNYSEAQSAESGRDFVHKLGVCLKELRETFINLKIIDRASLHSNNKQVNSLSMNVTNGSQSLQKVSIQVNKIKISFLQ